MRRLFSALLLLVIATSAQAADGAQSRAIGFSADGRYFAFEQYGIQDGSGFAYSDIFVLDVIADSWVKGTPIRVLDENETNEVDTARAKALTQAAAVLKETGATGGVDTLAHMPFTELGAERGKVRFARYYASTADTGAYDALGSWELSVKNVPVPVPADCTDTDIAMPMGMEVTLKSVKSGTAKAIAKDTSLPKSRFCAHDYDIEAIFAPSRYDIKNERFVALIGVYSRGFEGSDRRFIAVPFELVE